MSGKVINRLVILTRPDPHVEPTYQYFHSMLGYIRLI